MFAIRNNDNLKIKCAGFNCLWLRENSRITGSKMTVSYSVAALAQVSVVRCQPYLSTGSDTVDIHILRTREGETV